MAPQQGEFTAGYYLASGWKEFTDPGEVYVCDNCMWQDARYIKVFGNVPWIP